MARGLFSKNKADLAVQWEMFRLAKKSDKVLLARWAAQCAEAVLPLFELSRPNDLRPRMAIETLRAWLRGECNVTPARRMALRAHAAARQSVGPSKAAARSAGQAVSTAHARMHSVAAAYYAEKAVPGQSKTQLRRLVRLLAAEAKA